MVAYHPLFERASDLLSLATGNYHAAIVCPKDRKEEAEEILDKLRRRGLELEGTITGEHGIGLKLRDMLVEEVGEEAVDMMRKVRHTLTGTNKEFHSLIPL